MSALTADQVWATNGSVRIVRFIDPSLLWVRASQPPTDNRARMKQLRWLRDVACEGHSRPSWDSDDEMWTVSKNHLNEVVMAARSDMDSVYLIREYNSLAGCGKRCRDSVGYSCACPCLGENHGAGEAGSWGRNVGDGYWNVEWQGRSFGITHFIRQRG